MTSPGQPGVHLAGVSAPDTIWRRVLPSDQAGAFRRDSAPPALRSAPRGALGR